MKPFHTTALIASLVLLLPSCEKDIYKETFDIIIPSDYAKTKENHLHFDSEDKLDTLLDSISTRCADLRSPDGDLGIEGFTSIMQRYLAIPETKTTPTDEEYRLRYTISRIDDLLPPDELKYVMDTSLIIGVGDYTYKITDLGTFRFPASYDEKDIEEYTSSFTGVPEGIWDNLILPGGVLLINSYGKGYEQELTPEEDTETRVTNLYPSGPNLQSGYNTDRYFWGWNWIGNDLFGVNQSKEAYFDDNRRVRFHFWNVNLGFMSTSGFTVSLQKKTKWLFIEYWEKAPAGEAQDMVIGINYLDFWHLNWATGNTVASIAPGSLPGYTKANFLTQSGGRDYWCGYAREVPFITDYSEENLFAVPYFQMNGVNPAKASCENSSAIYGFTTRELYQVIEKTRSLYGKGREFPCEVFAPGFNGGATYNTCRSIISGLRHYKGESEHKVTLVNYGRVALYPSWGNVGKMFKNGSINSSQGIDIFGAVKYNGKWKGINFYGKETEVNSPAIY